MIENIDVAALLAADNWIALIALVVAFVATRLSKDDTRFPTIPARWRPVFAILMGEVVTGIGVAVYNAAVATNIGWRTALVVGLKAGAGAIVMHALAIKTLRNGKDIMVPKSVSKFPPPPDDSDGGGLAVPVIPAARIPKIPPVQEEIPTKPTLLTVALVFVVAVAPGCGFFTAQNAKTLLDLSKTLCVLANVASDDTAVQAICGIVDREVGPMKDLLRAERTRVAAVRAEERAKVAACKPEDAGAP